MYLKQISTSTLYTMETRFAGHFYVPSKWSKGRVVASHPSLIVIDGRHKMGRSKTWYAVKLSFLSKTYAITHFVSCTYDIPHILVLNVPRQNWHVKFHQMDIRFQPYLYSGIKESTLFETSTCHIGILPLIRIWCWTRHATSQSTNQNKDFQPYILYTMSIWKKHG